MSIRLKFNNKFTKTYIPGNKIKLYKIQTKITIVKNIFLDLFLSQLETNRNDRKTLSFK